jgi:RNA polymerase subunit RPABC4/transcription elongation factor Spt4
MRDPQSISRERRRTPDSGVVDRGCRRGVCAGRVLFLAGLPEQQHHPPPLGLRIYFNLSWGVLAALYFLMVGYVSKDAPRRAMSARFWMLICFVMPGGIGAVLYFLLRQPEVSRCPACSTHVQSDFHFCPQCDYQLTANCGNCFRTVRATDQFCTRCGHELASDHMPARLRVLGE